MHPELAVLSRSNYRAPRVSQNKLTFDFMVRSSEQFFLHCSLNSLNSVRSVSKVLLFDNLESLERTSLDLLLRKLLNLKLTSFERKIARYLNKVDPRGILSTVTIQSKNKLNEPLTPENTQTCPRIEIVCQLHPKSTCLIQIINISTEPLPKYLIVKNLVLFLYDQNLYQNFHSLGFCREEVKEEKFLRNNNSSQF